MGPNFQTCQELLTDLAALLADVVPHTRTGSPDRLDREEEEEEEAARPFSGIKERVREPHWGKLKKKCGVSRWGRWLRALSLHRRLTHVSAEAVLVAPSVTVFPRRPSIASVTARLFSGV